MTTSAPSGSTPYNRFLLCIAGLGGLLYGIDVGIIAGALPYLEATSGYNVSQLSTVVAAVLLGGVFSSLFAGMASDIFGRKKIMILSALLFIVSVPMICLSSDINMLLAGRLLQGISGGLIGVVIPLYLAECLNAQSRGKGTGMFQFMLTLGLVAAALIGWYYAAHVEGIEKTPGVTGEVIFAAKDSAWRNIFWVSLLPGVVFLIGTFFVSESPRWLFRKGRKEQAKATLIRSNGEQEASVIMAEMEATDHAAAQKSGDSTVSDSLLQRKYVIPFILALIILACNQATGINSVLAYAVNIFHQGGLVGEIGNRGDVLLKIVNCIMTVVAVVLVDRKGRKFLLKMGTGGIILSLAAAGFLFHSIESKRVDKKDALLSSLTPATTVTYKDANGVEKKEMDLSAEATAALKAQLDQGGTKYESSDYLYLDISKPEAKAALGLPEDKPAQAIVSYSYGPYTNVLNVDNGSKDPVLRISPPKDKELEDSPIGQFFRSIKLNPFADLTKAKGQPLLIERALVGERPSTTTGWLVAISFIVFIAAFAAGPGVCVWLALSELMPTRIRSNGMSIALLANMAVSTTIAAMFLPTVGRHGYATMIFIWAGCTVIYFITAAFFLPETKGKTLEEIEEHFEGKKGKA